MAKDTATPAAETRPRTRSPKAGKRITITLTDEHYERITKLAAADDREPNGYLSRVVRLRFNDLTDNTITMA